MRRWLKIIIQGLPQRSLSRLMGRLLKSRFSKWLIRPYAKSYAIDTREAEKNLSQYASLTEFFTRRLKPEARPIADDPKGVVSPVDGKVLQAGEIREGTLIQAKGKTFTVQSLLGDAEPCSFFLNGHYVVLYLSPKDYHRIHMPFDGRAASFVHVPGRLFPVNRIGMEHVDQLFSRNERFITFLDSDAGRAALVKVGAFFVGSIRVHFDSNVMTNERKGRLKKGTIAEGSYRKGDEIGYFEFGSTVILLFEKGMVRLSEKLQPGTQVKMGEKIGELLKGKG